MLGKYIFGFVACVAIQHGFVANTIMCQTLPSTGVEQCELSSGEAKASPLYGIESMPYAQCSQVKCQLAPNKKQAQCRCDLINAKSGWQALSLSIVPYQVAKPEYDSEKNLRSVQSNYSMANLSDFKQPLNQTCTYKKPAYWADCYGVRCAVKEVITKGKQQYQTYCTCPVKKSTSFLIGVKGDSACHVSGMTIWSAAHGQAMKAYGGNPMLILYQKIYPDSPPVQAINNHSTGNE